MHMARNKVRTTRQLAMYIYTIMEGMRLCTRPRIGYCPHAAHTESRKGERSEAASKSQRVIRNEIAAVQSGFGVV